MADSGVASPTMEMDHHFPSVYERARSSTRALTRSGRISPTHSASGSLIRASIIRMQEERKAKKVKFYRNGDRFFHGLLCAVSCERFRSLDSLMAVLTDSPLGDNKILPKGVRHIFTLDGRTKIIDVDDLEDGECYVCCSIAQYKKMDYPKSLTPLWNTNAMPIKDGVDEKGTSGKIYDDTSNKDFIFPKLVTVIRNGSKPRKAVRILLNKKTAHSFEQVLRDMTDAIKLDTGAVRKVYTLDGRPLTKLEQFFEDENVFLAFGNERYALDDFEIDHNEIKFVSAYCSVRHKEPITLKSPKMNRRVLSEAIQGLDLPSRRGFPSPKSARKIIKSPPVAETVLEAPPKLVKKYRVGKSIGEGNFAQVRECTQKTKKTQYALKIISKVKCKGREQMIDNEVSILREVKHENIIQLIEDFDGPKELFLVMELVKGGDLFEAISNATKYTERDASGMVYNLASALQYLHANNIVHRDIKPENILVCEFENGTKSLKLGDFGLAIRYKEPLTTVCGTPTYVAPEIIAEKGYGLKVDVWSMGVITYILLCGFPPFVSASGDQEELFDKITSGKFEFVSPYWDSISTSAKELIAFMLQVDPENRYSAADVEGHAWVAEDVASEDQDISSMVAGKLHENFVTRRPCSKQGVALIAATALDHQSRYFRGRKDPDELPLQQFPANGHQEVF